MLTSLWATTLATSTPSACVAVASSGDCCCNVKKRIFSTSCYISETIEDSHIIITKDYKSEVACGLSIGNNFDDLE